MLIENDQNHNTIIDLIQHYICTPGAFIHIILLLVSRSCSFYEGVVFNKHPVGHLHIPLIPDCLVTSEWEGVAMTTHEGRDKILWVMCVHILKVVIIDGRDLNHSGLW